MVKDHKKEIAEYKRLRRSRATRPERMRVRPSQPCKSISKLRRH